MTFQQVFYGLFTPSESEVTVRCILIKVIVLFALSGGTDQRRFSLLLRVNIVQNLQLTHSSRMRNIQLVRDLISSILLQHCTLQYHYFCLTDVHSKPNW